MKLFGNMLDGENMKKKQAKEKNNDIKTFNISVQGAKHIKYNKICQDNSFSASYGKKHIIIVCDGHGGDDYFRSDKGSRFACESAYECIKNFLENSHLKLFEKGSENQRNNMIEQLEKSIIATWNQKVLNDLRKYSFSESELSNVSEKAKENYISGKRIESAYGTTLLAAVVTKMFWFGFQIGDGKCVVLQEDGDFFQPIPWNDKCFLNTTTSLCDFDAINNFRFYYSENIPVAIYLGSDGIDDCFGKDEELYSLYKVISESFVECGFEKARNELIDYLPRLSQKGSGDDMSMAVVVNVEKLKTLKISGENKK